MAVLASGTLVLIAILGFLSTSGQVDKTLAYRKYLENNKQAPPDRDSIEYEFYFRHL